MKKLILLFLFLTIFILGACQSPAEDGRETVLDIYNNHSHIEFENVSLPENFHYSGFSSFTTSSQDAFELILLKEDIYSELIIEWDYMAGEDVTILSIQISYYDFNNEVYFTIESEKDNGLIYESLSYDEAFENFSSIRIDDIQWIIQELGYEIQ